MYLSHFSLNEEPFGVSPDGRFFYQSEQHKESLASLYYGIRQRRGFALLVGRAGLGKTSVLVQLIQLLENRASIAYLPHPFYDRATLLESILVSFGLEPSTSPAQNHRLFFQFLSEQRFAGKTCVVILDEAQDLSYDTLEAVRMLSNFEMPTEKLLQIVLSGQPRLAEILAQPAYEQLRQRMNVIARLQELDPQDIRKYVEQRLKVAGRASSQLFAPEALDAIAVASDGVPRNINTLCFHSLTIAFALNRTRVHLEDVSEAIRDLHLAAEAPGDASTSPAPFARSLRPALIAASVLVAALCTFFLRSFVWAH
jgi:general secretion pathway protein A